jgi:hypothetical protein
VIAKGEEFKSDFELNDTLWVSATIPTTKTVNLWLGVLLIDKANVMLEYTIEEATDLLTTKLENAHVSVKQVKEDLDIKEQITTMEVNMARIYNDDVKIR